MASATNNDEKTMATDLENGPEEPDDRRPEPRQEKPEGHGFFTIYKKGQGYWTRICSAGGAGLLILLSARFIYEEIPPYVPWLTSHRKGLLGVVVGISLAMALLIWRLMNKPSNVDFLIATDSEMKKVNWTSRRELFGSTKVVILFMFMIAAFLFTMDLYFTRIFYLFDVLHYNAPLWDWAKKKYGMAGTTILDVVMTFIVLGGAAWGIWGAYRSRKER